MTEVQQGATPHVCFNEVSVKRELKVDCQYLQMACFCSSILQNFIVSAKITVKFLIFVLKETIINLTSRICSVHSYLRN